MNDKLLYILGLMNSTLYKWLITQMTNLVETGKYAYGAKDKIEQLPIPQITESNKPLCDEIIKCVDKILEIKACHTEALAEVSKNTESKNTELKRFFAFFKGSK